MRTVGEMIADGRKVGWRCECCRAYGDVDLEAVLDRLGPDFSFANRRPSCRQCPGRVLFEDRTSLWAQRLDTIQTGDRAWHVFNGAERARLEGLGWYVEQGRWWPPDSKKPPGP